MASRPPVLALFILLIAVGTLAAIAYFRVGPLNSLLLILASIAPAVLVVPVLALRPDYDIFEPLSFVLLSVLVGVTARTYLLVMDPNPELVAFLLLGKPLSILLRGMAVIISGLAALALGYFIAIPRVPLGRIRALREDFHRRRLAVVLLPITAISVVSVVLFMRATGGWASVREGVISDIRPVAVPGSAHWAALGYYRYGSELALYAYCCVLAAIVPRRAGRSVPWIVVAVGLGLLAMVLPFLASSRTEALLIIVVTALVFHYARGRLHIRHIAVAAALGMAGFAVMGTLRAEVRAPSFQTAPGFTGKLEQTIGTRHWMGIDKTSLIVQAVPTSLPYQWGKTLVTWVTAPIPRTIWPNKGLVAIGPIIAKKVYGLNALTTGVPPGLVAELYWNFGWAGVLAGMFLFGVLLRVLYRSLRPLLLDGRPGAIVIYTVAVAPLALQLPATEVSGAVIAFLMAVVPTYLILEFVTASASR